MKDSLREDKDTGQVRSHNSLCEHAEHDVCNCWCNGKYHGIARMLPA